MFTFLEATEANLSMSCRRLNTHGPYVHTRAAREPLALLIPSTVRVSPS